MLSRNCFRLFSSVPRGAFKRLSFSDLETFKCIVGSEKNVVTDSTELSVFNEDWMKVSRGESPCLVRPSHEVQVAELVRYCDAERIALSIQGGNTGLVGGSVPLYDEVIVNLSNMNKILNFDETSGVLQCESGCILQNLDEHVSQYGFEMPLDLGAKGSCQIGGNVATNAGGIHFLRHGSLHGSVLGLRTVSPTGNYSGMSSLRKDNTGYHLSKLFIGSEGTLGVITAVSVLCPQKPARKDVAFCGIRNFQSAVECLRRVKANLVDILYAVEFMDQECMVVVNENLKLSSPFSTRYPMYVLIEVGYTDALSSDSRLEKLLSNFIDEGLVQNGLITHSNIQAKEIWKLRECIAEALLHDGYCYKYDVSLPIPQMYDLVNRVNERVRARREIVRCVGYGHLGDGNLHLNVTTTSRNDDVLALLEPFIFDFVQDNNGSVSAEHGIGHRKLQYMPYGKTPDTLNLMRLVKRTFDPNGILNPYKVLL